MQKNFWNRKNILKLVCACVVVLVVVIVSIGIHRYTVPRRPTHAQTDGDFVINISASSTRLRRGRNIEVSAVFENLSGERHEAVFGAIFENLREQDFTPTIIHLCIISCCRRAGATIGVAKNIILEEGGVIEQTSKFGSRLRRGRHELVAIVNFQIREDGVGVQFFTVHSNTIILTVI